MDFIFWALVIAVGLNLAMFIPAYLLKTDRLTDLSYSITFIVLALLGFSQSAKTSVQFAVLVMVLLWAIRLGGFLFIRINKMKDDSRFDEMRGKFWSFFRFWFFQGITVFIVLAAALALWREPASSVGVVSYLGIVVFAVGFALESVADYQKFRFSLTKTKDVWIDTGVWRFSRHPNYLGEIMVWVGIYLFAFSSLSSAARLLALVSPLYIAAILLFFSGVPLLEKSANKKWGHDQAYKNYKQHVPILIPTVASLRRLTK